MILSLIRKDPAREAAAALFASISTQSRDPRLYTDFGVDDSVDGRFELLILHAFLVLKQLKKRGPAEQRLAQLLTDLLFSSLDDALREMGVGDLSVAKKIRAMAEAFQGRIYAYDRAIDEPGSEALAAALARNVYGGSEARLAELASALALYVRRADGALGAQPSSRLMAGIAAFPPAEIAGDVS